MDSCITNAYICCRRILAPLRWQASSGRGWVFVLVLVPFLLGGCAYLPFDSRRWSHVKEITSIRWGTGDRPDKFEMAGFYHVDRPLVVEDIQHVFLLFYPDGTFVDFRTEEDDFDLVSAQSDLENFLRVRGIRKNIWKYDGSGIYEISGDTILVEEYYGDFFFFQNLWRWQKKREFIIEDRTHLREVKQEEFLTEGRKRDDRGSIEREPLGTCKFFPANNIPSSKAKLKRHRWLWNKQ